MSCYVLEHCKTYKSEDNIQFDKYVCFYSVSICPEVEVLTIEVVK